jgi:hypothetical protein
MQWPLALVGACVMLVALLAVYVPTIYIRKLNRVIKLLEQIEANTRADQRDADEWKRGARENFAKWQRARA